uniref:Endonuclease/exonuclease/phosphatase domain-containing protein n=1 Tax=Cacopsylla melanoneura TaxID=428564 RepID=A0A8D8ZAB3_9HEMI
MFNNNLILNQINNVTRQCETLQDIETWKNTINNDLFKMIHINIKSIGAKWDLLCIKLEPVLDILDVIVFTEINVKKDEADCYQLRNYKQISKCRVNRNGGGIMLFYRDKYQIEDYDYNLDEAENIFIKLKNRKNNIIWHILAIYRSPKLIQNRCLDDLNFWLQNGVKKDDNIIIVGDINICIMKKNSDNTKYLNTLYNNMLVPLIKSPTREETLAGSPTISSIDHINVRMKRQFVYTASVITDKVADHYFIALRISRVNNNNLNYAQSNSFKTVIINRTVQEQIEDTDWSSLNNINDPCEIYDKMLEKFETIYENSKKIVKIDDKKCITPWVNERIKEEIKLKQE